VGLVEDEVESAANRAPFFLDGGPCGVGGGGDLLGAGLATASFGGEVGDFVFDEGADEPEVVAGGGEDAVLAVGVPTGDAVFEFGWAVEVDFLGALNGPVFEDAVAARGGVTRPR
jgi:hypothetical protein